MPNFEVMINSERIELVDEIDFLGITLDKHLNWNSHISKISLKISKIIGMMYKLKKILTLSFLKIIYCSLVQSQCYMAYWFGNLI